MSKYKKAAVAAAAAGVCMWWLGGGCRQGEPFKHDWCALAAMALFAAAALLCAEDWR